MKNSFLEKMRELTLERVSGRSSSEVTFDRRPHDFKAALRGYPSIIAEIKFASPSEGVIRHGEDVVKIAGEYIRAGASALSILTEPHYFKGSLNYIEQVRKAYPESVILMKDFILSECQLYDGLRAGADAVLLIVGFLEKSELIRLNDKAQKLGLSVLVEVHNKEELETALELGCPLIGVNNRNLKTLETDLNTSRELSEFIPEGVMRVSESGIKNAGDLDFLRENGYEAFLMGSHLMKESCPGSELRKIIEEARND